jgi:hypothetical protein
MYQRDYNNEYLLLSSFYATVKQIIETEQEKLMENGKDNKRAKKNQPHKQS